MGIVYRTAGVGTVPDTAAEGLAVGGTAAPVEDVAPTGPLTFGVTPVVIAPGGALVAGVGAL